MSNTGSKREGSTLNIGALREGVVLDHIRAGYAMTIYKYLKLDKLECTVAHNITVNVIKNNEIVEKRALKLPKQVVNIIRCKNPRCITSVESALDQVFVLADEEKEIYRCRYCEEMYHPKIRK